MHGGGGMRRWNAFRRHGRRHAWRRHGFRRQPRRFRRQPRFRGSAVLRMQGLRITADSSITASIALRSLARPIAYAAYDSCWRRTWTPYGLQWVDVCGDYGYYAEAYRD